MTYYIATDWYWTDGLGVVYSSAARAIVPDSDAAYKKWLALGNAPTELPNDNFSGGDSATLDEVMTRSGLPPTGLTPPSKADLIAYANSKVTALLAIPKSYGPLGAGGPTVECDGTTATGVSLAAINAWGTAAPTATQPWLDDYGVATTITGAQGVLLAAAAGAYARSVWAIAAAACTAVLAGTTTTTAQIDAEAWPT